MGYIRHHAIVVTGTYEDWAKKARKKAVQIFGAKLVSKVTEEVTNGTSSFFVAPDGSKEGWNESKIGDTNRVLFVDWLRKQAYEDGSSPLAWVEVQYGDDDYETRICADSDEELRHQYREQEVCAEIEKGILRPLE